MIHLVTFATDDMSRSASLCARSAVMNGVGSCQTFVYHPYDVRKLPYYAEHKSLFDAPRGCGYWAFKPALIQRLIGRDCFVRNISEGDIVIYADAGIEFLNNVNYIIDRMDQDIFLFGNNWEHAHWCKRDIVNAIWNEGTSNLASYRPGYERSATDSLDFAEDGGVHWALFGEQVQASVVFFRVSDYSRKFVDEWLKWCLHRVRFSDGVCTDEWRYLVDDSPSIAPNHPEFRENRHDQAILTTLAYREGLKLHYWPASYNDGAFNYEKLPEYANDDYPILFNHHRRRDVDWSAV